jgi:hypothetical protein
MPKKIVTHRVIVTPPARPECEEVAAEPANLVVTTEDGLRALARRCGELLVKKADACPPGHWLG